MTPARTKWTGRRKVWLWCVSDVICFEGRDRVPPQRKGKLGQRYEMRCYGRPSPDFLAFKPAKRLGKRADYCPGCTFPSQCEQQVFVFTLEWTPVSIHHFAAGDLSSSHGSCIVENGRWKDLPVLCGDRLNMKSLGNVVTETARSTFYSVDDWMSSLPLPLAITLLINPLRNGSSRCLQAYGQSCQYVSKSSLRISP